MNLLCALMEDSCEPYKKYPSDAGYDLRVYDISLVDDVGQYTFQDDTFQVSPGTYRFHCRVRVLIPEGHFGFIVPRSSWRRQGLVCQAVIDAGYTGELCPFVTVTQPVFILRGERVLQILIIPVANPAIQVVEQLPHTQRGTSGAGHSGRF